MAQMTPQVSEVPEKALELSTEERGLLIDRLTETLDSEPAEEGVEAAWDDEIKRRVDDIRTGRVKTIPGEQVLRGLAEEFPDGGYSRFDFIPRRGRNFEDAVRWYRAQVPSVSSEFRVAASRRDSHGLLRRRNDGRNTCTERAGLSCSASLLRCLP